MSSSTSPPTTNANALQAFLIVLGAGMATSIGAAVVFVPQLVKLASKRVLASSLGLSAGVMIYVSLVEIFVKSDLSFQDAGYGERSYLCATLCFFGGIFSMMLLDGLIKCLAGDHHHDHAKRDEEVVVGSGDSIEIIAPHCCLDGHEDPVAQLEDLQRMAGNEVELKDIKKGTIASEMSDSVEDFEENSCEDHGKSKPDVLIHCDNIPPSSPKTSTDPEKKRLVKMGVNTAVAIALHNFPEGLATFIASLSDPTVGFILAIAIGIHNVPEGLCVSLPIYYATGSRWRGFFWGFCSGLSEPVAALLGWVVLATYFTDTAFAILFGLVAGMMVMISIRELLPTAHRYDPEDTVVTYSLVFGMAIMAVSLVLFTV